ncbi:MAG TPA: carboxymuconolactone decarboxylase family protein [Actinomycetota bacterium]|nr:carboxymuconolactone decarboxylase family protein [Actinomycetota bacterium]
MTLRLAVLEHGQSRRARVLFAASRRLGKAEMDPVVKISLYRPEVFGRQWLPFVRSVMRGPSPWSPAERELLAAFVSHLNRCPFCATVHGEIAGLRSGQPVTIGQLEDWEHAGFSDRVAATMAFLATAVRDPGSVAPAAAEAARQRGVSDEDLAAALDIAFVFCLINRLANAFGFEWASPEDAVKGARMLNRIAYRFPLWLVA